MSKLKSLNTSLYDKRYIPSLFVAMKVSNAPFGTTPRDLKVDAGVIGVVLADESFFDADAGEEGVVIDSSVHSLSHDTGGGIADLVLRERCFHLEYFLGTEKRRIYEKLKL